ncbi:MAG: hypothetical protein Q9Q40_00465 [Acidobacteriota bacterium]|nr:hypothetical protein [Acidobacteriota bacterium]MDQ7088792.1 hypothetical protein [Acidobacteriota bacterium]
MNHAPVAGRVGTMAVVLLALLAPGWSSLQAAPPSARLDFVEGEALKVGLSAGSVRLTALKITADSQRLSDSLLPPRGGQQRYSWKRYEIHVENSGARAARVRVHLRLLDAQGAVIDEFTLSSRVARARVRAFSLRRLTLNYVVPLIRQVELRLEVE